MALNSLIEWTQTTWNCIRGCSMCSPGCLFCYAMMIAARFSRLGRPFHGYAVMTKKRPKWTGKVALIEHLLNEPLHWKKPRVIFVNSMSDLFHEDLPTADILRVFEVMNQADWHIYQILTKRSERLREMSASLPWGKHIWMGVSVENADYVHRIDNLRCSGAHVKFLSIEPLLGPLPNLNLAGIDWVICGGESGPRARPMNPDWARSVRDQCQRAGVAFFFKQWGGVNKKKSGRLLDGRTWDEMPTGIQLSNLFGDVEDAKPAGSLLSLPVLE